MGTDQIELQAQVLGLLQKFRGTEPLKELFWSRLNYNRANKPITRRGWAEATSALLHEDPVLLATGASDDAFRVVYSRLAENRLPLGGERLIVSRLLKDCPYSLFLFSDKSQTNWHFVNVKLAEDESKRKLFRRITVGPYEQMRTASQVISQLDLASISPDFFRLSPLVIQQRHDQAFDVEPVTEEFFTQYRAVFEKVEGLIRGIRDRERKRLFTQRLFNRLMFIAFIQKKGWLQFSSGKNQDYLNALWSDYKKNGNKEMGFYYERLYNLFFHGLGDQQADVGISKINRGGVWADYIGKVPYLNGGLFEEDEDDKHGYIKVPDEAIRAILQELFNRFNFTVTEATPLDIEVAVDPEMLGKVFEELVTGRHETGSYYTPKPIVSFMCREALKGYLESNLPKEMPEKIARFIDEHDPGGLHDGESVLEMLRRIRVCDPACGSGAYLLGMLHELMDLRTCLFSAKKIDPISAYDRKLEIIQKNVYGVDIDAFAVNIARLRLWLSLAVEFEGDDPPPLPNLKFEIEEGDSLGAPGPEPQQGVMWSKEIEQFSEMKAKYIKAHGEKKKSLEQAIVELKRSIASWAHHGSSVSGFDWAVEYAEVFRDGGFDIVVANPPYVRMELFKELKPTLKRNFPLVHAERADLYCYFYARAIELLRRNGMMSFISSNKWLKAAYGANLRQFISESCCITSITDFGELPVFKAATFPMILVAQKHDPQRPVFSYTQVRSLEPPYPQVAEIVAKSAMPLPRQYITGREWTLSDTNTAAFLEAIEKASITLNEYAEGKIYRGVVTGLNEAFIIDKATRDSLIRADKKSVSVIKPLVVGDDVRKWRIKDKNRFMLYTHHGIDPRGVPVVIEYLRAFQSELKERATEQEWYELQQPQEKFMRAFESPKIVFPDIAKESRFTMDESRAFPTNTVYLIPKRDYYLLGVLNSSVMWRYCKERLSVLGDANKGGRLRFFRQFVEKLPIPKATEEEKDKISKLAQECVASHGIGCEDLERQIDVLVAGLYRCSAAAASA